ncbi:mycofactocin-coupled SDR family oxidoreductase (plasmid) [Rhodococcus opacus]|uniref:mycofactocin-coupled SDR family oxidoreductase n=1 Tax=Rhodococcus opacus TaxID=37919 RepID=UPI0034D29DCB
MGLEGKVAVITGGARGQGRSHAERLAEEGADIVLCDIAHDLDSVKYKMARPEDLEETVRRVKAKGRQCISVTADVTSTKDMSELADRAMTEFGRVDILLANAGILSVNDKSWEMSDTEWDETVGVNLTGVFKTCRAFIPHMIGGGRGGSIVVTSSVAGLRSYPAAPHYTAAKHGVVGLMRYYASELGEYGIRVNTIHPTSVRTPMVYNKFFGDWVEGLEPDLKKFITTHILPTGPLEPEDVSNSVAWLVSDQAKWITGATIPIDAGFSVK